MRRSATVAGLLLALAGALATACGESPADTQSTGAGSGGDGHGGGASSGGAGNGGSAGGGVVDPTISAWVGTNISADLPYVDITYQLNGFDTQGGAKNSAGYPESGVSGKSQTDIGFILPSGTYNISYKGTGTVTVSGIGALAGSWTAVGGEQHNQLQITATPGAFGNFLTIDIKNNQGQAVTDLHILHPGFDYGAKEIFLPQFLGLLTPFRALRFMDWLATNGNPMVNWAERPAATSFGRGNGEPYEHITELVNQTGKDGWINVPEHASDDFIHSFAQFIVKHLDFARIDAARKKQGFTTPFKLYIENSNETWNQGFSVYQTFLAAANADPARYPGAYTGTYGPSWMTNIVDLMKVGQYSADRLVKIAKVFRDEFAASGKSDIIAPVLAGWALGPGYSDVGLRFIKDNYGDPKTIIDMVAIAPYFGPNEMMTGALDTLFASTNEDIASKEATYLDFAKLRDEYGLKIGAYEGGQSLTGTANQTLKHLAQHDQRMYEAYIAYFDLWKKSFGEALFMHFSLAGIPGLPENIYQYGYWSSIIGVLEDPATCMPNLPTLTGNEPIDSVVHHCPKYRALREQAPP